MGLGVTVELSLEPRLETHCISNICCNNGYTTHPPARSRTTEFKRDTHLGRQSRKGILILCCAAPLLING